MKITKIGIMAIIGGIIIGVMLGYSCFRLNKSLEKMDRFSKACNKAKIECLEKCPEGSTKCSNICETKYNFTNCDILIDE